MLRNRIYANIYRLKEKSSMIKLNEINKEKDAQKEYLINEILLNGKL